MTHEVIKCQDLVTPFLVSVLIQVEALLLYPYLNSTSATLMVDISGIDPGAGGTSDSSAGDIDVTASASGGDSSSYDYAWVVTETADPL